MPEILSKFSKKQLFFELIKTRTFTPSKYKDVRRIVANVSLTFTLLLSQK